MTEAMLHPGDALLYRGKGFWSFLIRMRTWSPVSHVAIYIGNDLIVESREGQGVQEAPFHDHQAELFAVCRPNEPLDLNKGLSYFETVRGRKYDLWALLNFFKPKQTTPNANKLFCSEFASYFYIAAGMRPYNPNFDPAQVSPGMFLSSPHFDVVWQRDGEASA